MTLIVFLIEQLAIGLYIFIGIGIYLSLRRLARATFELRATRFELQRDFARYSRANALTTSVLLVEAGLIVLGIQNFVAPTLRATLDLAPSVEDVIIDIDFNTPTAEPLAQINIDENSIPLGSFGNDQIRITPTPTATPVGTIEPAPAAIGCDTNGAQLQIPANGQVIKQIVEIRGVAFTENFATYKLEISGDFTGGQFATMESYTQPVTTLGSLSQFNPAIYAEGTYQFRLAVFDISDTLRESCSVTIYVRPPAPTPTPGGR
ncbi:MAG: hypothetical protein IPK52_11025 [Chloroflexi bacterium]|nr:hypothetical protein [Chloroflexota bacterium]